MDVMLNGREAVLLREALRQYVSDMALEIGKTENFEWRQSLKDDKETLESIIERLEAAIEGDDASAPEALVVVVETRIDG